MNNNLYLLKLLKLFDSALQILEKNNLQKKLEADQLKTFKFKCLHNQKKEFQHMINTYKTRETLKTLYLINFEETLDNNLLNRTDINLLNLLKVNSNIYTQNILKTETNILETYHQTLTINLLYKLHKIRKIL